MAFTLSGSRTLVSGNETGLSYRTWLGSNPTAGKQLTANTVEALFQLKIQNGAVFDTSDIVLVTNHRVEGQANATTDTGIWRCKGGVVIVQGNQAQLAEEWAIQDWDNVQVYIQKTNGNQSFIGSNARPIPASVKNTKFIVKKGDIDAHLQSTGGTGTLSNILLRNEGTNPGIIGLRETDTSDIEMYRIEPFGWSNVPTTFHKNWKMYNSSKDEINYHYRRNSGGAVFYNTVNSFNGNRMTAIRYVANGAETGANARSVIVGAYSPKLIDTSKNPLSGVQVAIYKTSDNSLEASGATGSDGKISIVNSSSNIREQSYNNTFTSGGVNYNRVIYNSGTKYIKQSITPTTTGGNVVSVDQGTFKIVQRRKDLQEIIVTQSFQSDYSGDVVVLSDTYYTTDQSANVTIAIDSGIKTITITGINTLDNLYDYVKYWLTQNMSIANFMSASGKNVDMTDYQIVGLQYLTQGTKLTRLQSTGTLTSTGAFSIEVIGTVNQATPTNLEGVITSGTLVYNTNTDTTITITNCTLGTVRNDGTGMITINKVNSTITNYVDAEINFIDSSISVIGADSITIHPTANDRNLNQNISATFTSSYGFKYGSLVNGTTMSGTLYLRCVSGTIPSNLDVNIIIGDNVKDLGMTALLSSLGTKIDNKPTLAQIEASSVLAKKSQVEILNRNTIKASKLIPASEII